MKKLLLFLLIVTMILSACTLVDKQDVSSNNEAGKIDIENEEKPTELTVYGVGTQVVDTEREENTVYNYFITAYEMGPYGPLADAARDDGYMFYGPIKEFEKETGIKINLQLFSGMEAMENYLIENQETENGPDIILIDYGGWNTAINHNNIYRLIYNGWFADMMPYLEFDEVYSSGEYYNEVLSAGELNNKQYILPLCFNMNGLFASQEAMQDLGVVIEQEMSSADLLCQLRQACLLANEGELVLDNLSLWSTSTTFVQDYWESTGCPVVDYETGEVTVNRQVFEEIAESYKEYMRMNLVADWDSVVEKAEEYLYDSWWNAYVTPGGLQTLDESLTWYMCDAESGIERINQGVFFFENGTATGGSHAITGQCAVLDTIYRDLKENMVMVGMPMYENRNQYMAQVQQYGCISADSKYPYYCYQLLKYLIDQEYNPNYVIPVKKANAESMLNQLSSTTYTLHLDVGAAWGENQDFSLDKNPYVVQPLNEDLKQQLQTMLDHIGGAILPQTSVYIPLLWHMEAYAFELESMDEAYENCCTDLKLHLQYIMAGNSDRNLDYDGQNYNGYKTFLLE